MGDYQAGDVGMRLEILLEPLDVRNIEVVGRFVEQQHVGPLEHGTRQRQLHLPPTGQRAHLLRLPTLGARGEAELLQDGRDSLPSLLGDGRVLGDELEDADVGILALVVLDIARAKDVLGREALQLAARDAPHERGLPSAVSAAEAISVALKQAEVGMRERGACLPYAREKSAFTISTSPSSSFSRTPNLRASSST